MWRLLIFSTIGAFAVAAAGAQPNDRPPVIDMHVHSTTTSPDALSQLVHRFHETDHMWGIHNFRRWVLGFLL